MFCLYHFSVKCIIKKHFLPQYGPLKVTTNFNIRGASSQYFRMVNGVEVGWKYDIVKAVTLNLLRILKNPALFWSFESENYFIIDKKNLNVFRLAAPVSVRITKANIDNFYHTLQTTSWNLSLQRFSMYLLLSLNWFTEQKQLFNHIFLPQIGQTLTPCLSLMLLRPLHSFKKWIRFPGHTVETLPLSLPIWKFSSSNRVTPVSNYDGV